MFSSSRYLATVRREMGQPCSVSRVHSFWSERGLVLSSSRIRRRSSSLAAQLPTSAPLSPAARRERK